MPPTGDFEFDDATAGQLDLAGDLFDTDDVEIDGPLERADLLPSAKGQLPTLAASRRAYTRRLKHRTATLRQINEAAATIGRLPKPGETLHLILAAKHFTPYDLLPAVIHLAGRPADHVVLTSLGINDHIIADLDRRLTSGEIGRADLLLSHYFAAVDEATYTKAAEMVRRHGGRAAAARCHAKLIMARFPDGPTIVTETSGNLRSCKCIEQAAIFNDPALWQFHAAWIDDLIDQAERR